MTKPVITKRATKGSALTYDELDANFQNLDDATISIKAGTGGTAVTSDLNGTITLVAGTGITLSGDNTTKELTINSSGGNAFGNVVVGGTTVAADAPSDTLTLVAGSNITLTPNSSTDTITIASTAVSGLTNPLVESINTNNNNIYSGSASYPISLVAGALATPKITLYMDASGTDGLVEFWSAHPNAQFYIGQQVANGTGTVSITSPLKVSPITTTQRNANSSLTPGIGLIYNSTTGTLQVGNNSAGWKNILAYTTTPTTLSGFGITDGISTAGGTITGDLIVTGTAYDKGITISGDRANIYIGNNTRDARTIISTNSLTGYYSGQSISRAGTELWFAGANATEQYVIRANGTTDAISINPTTGVVTIAGGITGVASSATKLATARAINGVNFDGTAAITVTADANTLTGTTLKSTVVSSSLTSLGTLTNATIAGGASVTANAATDKYLAIGTHGQMFDDGNFHVHTATGSLWLNSLDGGDIQLGMQSNSGTSNVKANGTFSMNSGYGSVAPVYGVRAWISCGWNGTTMQTYAGGNLSVSRSSAGVYVFTFTTAMPDGNYCINATARTPNSNSDCAVNIAYNTATNAYTFTLVTARYGTGNEDVPQLTVSVIR